MNRPGAVWIRTQIACCVAMGAIVSSRAEAHVGPPFPLLVDVPAGDDLVSVWADPDIGQAEFYIVLEAPDGTPPAAPDRVWMWVQPVSGRLERTIYPAERQKLRNRLQYFARPGFDRQDLWTIGFGIERAGLDPIELVTEVESTPPGTGPWDLLIYFFPFALVAAFWLVALTRLRRRRRELPIRTHPPAANHLAPPPER